MRSLLTNVKGNVAVFTAISASAMFGAAGLAITMVQANYESTAMQAALDAAVLSATALPYGTSDADRISNAETVFGANASFASFGPSDPADEYKVGEAVVPFFTVSEARVGGTAKGKVEPGLGSFLGFTDLEVTVSAQAEKIDSGQVCVLALNSDTPNGIEVYGNAQFNAHDCAAQANSDDGEGLRQYGSKSSATASMFGVNGGYKGDNFSPQPMTGIEPTKDPYADLPVPDTGPCMNVAFRLQGDAFTLRPGTYCGGIDIKAGAQVQLEPGIYIIKDGQLSINSGAVVTGTEVMFAFVGANSYLHMLSQAKLTVTSPTSGTYKNMQFMSDRDLSKSKFNGEWMTVLGGAKLEYDGVMYLPEQQIWVSGSNHDTIIRGYSPTMIMVADKIWSQGNAVFDLYLEDRRDIGVDMGVASFSFGSRLVQ